MRNTLLIALLLIHILGNTELRQLLSLSKILEHYRLHQIMDPREGFVSYICEHYGGYDGTEGDDMQDRELPFKNFFQQGTLTATRPPFIYFVTTEYHLLEGAVFPGFIPGPVPSPYKNALLRPPCSMI
ncbi:MAG: hypothetical protein HYU71_06800 [Bacteroidetes bacterium]|nr:hypothetical protein [Bacteroidota bacterium]